MALWLSLIAAILVVIASAAGIVSTDTYVRETSSGAIQGMSQDIVNLVAVTILLISAYFVNRGSIKAFLVWSGVLIYLVYTYTIYAFAVHYNRLFLLYVAILGLSLYALVVTVVTPHLDRLAPIVALTTKARPVSVFFGVVALLFYGQWL
ncbi:MAG: hypothetical protein H0X24_02075, partial [Ktedonobacterales bacterium]|nr:hypothetical protein [Ktedonobacterales bacterium]